MLYACVQRFDVTKNLKKFCKILETKQAHGSFGCDVNTQGSIMPLGKGG